MLIAFHALPKPQAGCVKNTEPGSAFLISSPKRRRHVPNLEKKGGGWENDQDAWAKCIFLGRGLWMFLEMKDI